MNDMATSPSDDTPLLAVDALQHCYGSTIALADVSFQLFPGEILAVVGESGSGKSTLLKVLSSSLRPDDGTVRYHRGDGRWVDIHRMPETERRQLARTEWGFVTQHANDGLRLEVSAGANIEERPMALGANHYGQLRSEALAWMAKVELPAARIDDRPRHFSGGMKQRLQIARNLVTRPRLVLLDEPTSGLDVSVQARLLDLLRGLVTRMGLAVVLVTHDLGVARLLAHRTIVMRHGEIVESGLTDQVLDDPRHAYTQLLVSSIVS